MEISVGHLYNSTDNLPKPNIEVLGWVDIKSSMYDYKTFYPGVGRFTLDFVRWSGSKWLNRYHEKVVVDKWATYTIDKDSGNPLEGTRIDSKPVSERLGTFASDMSVSDLTDALRTSGEYGQPVFAGIKERVNTGHFDVFADIRNEVDPDNAHGYSALPLAEETWVNSFALNTGIPAPEEIDENLSRGIRYYGPAVESDEIAYDVGDTALVVYDALCHDIYLKDATDGEVVCLGVGKTVKKAIHALTYLFKTYGTREDENDV